MQEVYYRALNLFLQPQYLIRVHKRAPRLSATLAWLHEHLYALPLLHEMGDQFLMVLRKRE